MLAKVEVAGVSGDRVLMAGARDLQDYSGLPLPRDFYSGQPCVLDHLNVAIAPHPPPPPSLPPSLTFREIRE